MNKRQISQLRSKAKRFHVTREAIAKKAGVTPPMVSHVFHFRAKSQKILDVTKQLIREKVDEARRMLGKPSDPSMVISASRS